MRKPLFAGLLMLSVAAMAQTVTDRFNVNVSPQEYKADVVMDQRLRVLGALSVTSILGTDGGVFSRANALGTTSWDFPPLSTAEPLGVVCSETNPVTTTGAAMTDGCMASSDLGSDGGAALLLEADLTCRVSATSRTIGRLCVRSGTDGGIAYNLHDAGFYFRTFR
jgi:hypothetical protein